MDKNKPLVNLSVDITKMVVKFVLMQDVVAIRTRFEFLLNNSSEATDSDIMVNLSESAVIGLLFKYFVNRLDICLARFHNSVLQMLCFMAY